MIRTDLLVNSPIFLSGLTQALNAAGIRIVAIRDSPEQDPSWLADAALIDAAALPWPGELTPITMAAKSMPVLVLTHEGSTDDDPFLMAGATGTVSKAETAEGIVRAVEMIISGNRVGAARTEPSSASARNQSEGVPLSEREEQVLRLIAHGLTHQQIALRLAISPHTVDTYVKRIRAKLGAGNKAELTRAALIGQLATRPPVPAPAPESSGENRLGSGDPVPRPRKLSDANGSPGSLGACQCGAPGAGHVRRHG